MKGFKIACVSVSVVAIIFIIVMFTSAISAKSEREANQQTQTQNALVSQFETAYGTMYDGYADKVSRNVQADNNVATNVTVTQQTSSPNILVDSSVQNQTTQETKSEPVIHEIIWGDTLSAISLKYGVSVNDIAKRNSIDNVNLIYANSALQIK